MSSKADAPLSRDMLALGEPAADRLPPMLFLAALFHALLILGVSFDPLDFDSGEDMLTVDVVLLNSSDQHLERVDEAAYLAAVSQSGTGNSDDPSSPGQQQFGLPLNSPPQEMLGDFAPAPTEQSDAQAEQVLATKAERQVDENNDANRDEKQASLLAESSPISGIPEKTPDNQDTEQKDSTLKRDDQELVFSVDTKRSDLAQYLYNWKQRVEAQGTDYYNQRIRNIDYAGSPVIEVAIDQNGQLREIVVRQTSGSGLVDQAALNVLRRAAPYAPIPAHLREQYQTLRFRYKFEFARSTT